MRPSSPTRRAGRTAALVLVLLVVGACGGGEGGGGEGGDGARPTISPTRTPTATLPSPELPSPTRSLDESDRPELPSPTRSPDRTDSPEPPDPTRSPDRTDSPEEPAPEETSTEAQPKPEPEPEPEAEPEAEPTTESPSADSSPTAADAAAEDEGAPSWVWWLAALLLAAGAVAAPLWVRARRRGAWRQELAVAESEVVWFARVLLPELRQVGSAEQLAGGWAVGQTRVAAAEDQLTALESTAPDDPGRERARTLRDAVRLARGRLQQLTGPGPHDNWALDLDAIIADLEVVLGGPPVTPPAEESD